MELKKWEIGKFKNQDLTPSTSFQTLQKVMIKLFYYLTFLLSYFLTILLSHFLRELGWKPKTSLEEGIKTTYEWYVSTREAKQTR